MVQNSETPYILKPVKILYYLAAIYEKHTFTHTIRNKKDCHLKTYSLFN